MQTIHILTENHISHIHWFPNSEHTNTCLKNQHMCVELDRALTNAAKST